MSAYFITATGTDIGKTFATCALSAATGWPAYKPVISGFTGTDTDTHRLIDAMGQGKVEEVSPWRFTAPLSPDMAAAREGRVLDYAALLDWCRARAQSPGFIEGVGGVMVPLDDRHTTRDWMHALGLPVILVAGSYLGSISHTLSAVEVLNPLSIRAILVSESAQSSVPLADTCATLARHTRHLIVPQPRVSSWREATAIHALAKELL